ncbi:hypothetical protein E1A91_D07G171000v1 [Gossypium mustelinum]|uniref:Uncharacterized protein n=1 Tax=Gossypium mustelinum TaxID=34275 RepID=A0A5D2UBU4_GOSMU|nr:hypothetical protein E1A91_D07G171000v1 [Gossypium mustelinum]
MARLMLNPTWLSNLLVQNFAFKPQKLVLLLASSSALKRNNANTSFSFVCGRGMLMGYQIQMVFILVLF